jgi:hypothetical protein
MPVQAMAYLVQGELVLQAEREAAQLPALLPVAWLVMYLLAAHHCC